MTADNAWQAIVAGCIGAFLAGVVMSLVRGWTDLSLEHFAVQVVAGIVVMLGWAWQMDRRNR